LTDYTTGAFYEYSKNPDYWDSTTIDGKKYKLPFVDKLVYPIIKDYGVRAASLRTGKLDAITHFPWTYHESLINTTKLRYWSMNAEGYPFIAPRFDVEPFDDIRVRAALSMAIDRDYIIRTIHGGYGISDNFTYAKDWGPKVHTVLEKQPKKVQEYYSYNPERARELLDEAGVPVGFKCEIDYDSSRAGFTDIMALIKDYWNDIGVDLTLKPHDTPTQKGIMRARSHKHMDAGYADAVTAAMGWVSDFRTGGEANVMMYSNPRADDLFMQWTTEEDTARQNALLKEINNIVIADLAHICLPSPNQFIYAWPWVRNFEGETTTKYRSGFNSMTIIWIDQIMKKEMGYK
jgi:peptide/nickel transport system substrate-binding protein